MDLLLNDKKSVADLNGQLKNPFPPQALLNGPRLYIELLKAFDEMGGDAATDARYADLRELDLYVTTTDAWGEVLPLRLYDKFVWERRYKSSFHFQFRDVEAGDKRNDFIGKNNPFLAFAARCTSSFPFAFEPIKLNDLQGWVSPQARVGPDLVNEWKGLFFDHPVPPTTNVAQWVEPGQRVFVDGGCLDNKPFGYVTRALQERSPNVAVSRKLLYVEPSPEHPELESQPSDGNGNIRKPDAIENAVRALMVLPLDETIREDLENIIERNRDIDRMNLLIHDVECDVLSTNDGDGHTTRVREAQAKWDHCAPLVETGIASADWANRGFRGGDAADVRYRGYSRLKVAGVTDDLALLVCGIAGFRRGSNEYYAVRCLIKAWRSPRYKDALESEEDRTLAHFLLRFDFAYRIRRLEFLLRRIDRLRFLSVQPDENSYTNERAAVEQLLTSVSNAPPPPATKPVMQQAFRDRLQTMRARISNALKNLQTGMQNLHTPMEKIPADSRDHAKWTGQKKVVQAIAAIHISASDLYEILGAAPESDRPVDVDFEFNEDRIMARATAVLEKRAFQAPLDNLDQELDEVLRGLFNDATLEIRGAFCVNAGTLSDPEAAACRLVRHYYDFFEDYDSILYPISYGTNLGEAAHVDVIRISPDDATSIVDESKTGNAKLAGVKLGHFGAFLDAGWRRNDILWGRLDAAERIIESLLIGVGTGEEISGFIARAQEAIIEEELGNTGLADIRTLFVETIVQIGTNPVPGQDAMTKAVQDVLKVSDDRTRLVLQAALQPAELRKAMESYVVNPVPDKQKTLESAGRAATVMGDIFQDLADKRSLPSHWTRWFAWAGMALRGLVELSAPRKFTHWIARYWFALAGLISAILIVMGPLLGEPAAQNLGIKLLLITAALFVVVRMLTSYLADNGNEGPQAGAKKKVKRRKPFVEFMGWIAIASVYFAIIFLATQWIVRLLK